MRLEDAALHTRGEAPFVDDLVDVPGMLHAAVFSSSIAHGRITLLDTSAVVAIPGVAGVLTAHDVPADNQIGNIILDEPLFAESEVSYVGDTVAVVVAESAESAHRAVQKIEAEFEPLPAIFDAREADNQGQLIAPPRTFSLGDVEAAWEDCDVIVEGRADSGAQEHVYLEPQGALAQPLENGGLKVIASTQAPSLAQRMIARVLGCPMNQIEVEVLRLGGGFGGKEEQATRWAVLAAVAAYRFNRPVKLVLHRDEDMRLTGKRHPYSTDFKIGLTRDGKIIAYDICLYQNAGAVADLSTAILERTLFHVTNSYYIPNVRATANSCKTHLPPNTACRGFGAPQAMYVMECAIDKAAQTLGVDASVIQERNLLQEGDTFPYGMQVRGCRARRCWDSLYSDHAIMEKRERIARFNADNQLHKKGLAIMPLCFGISFTSTFLNQASALVHVYTDGSVSVSCAAVDMGQGVNVKIQTVVARVFSLSRQRVKLERTNTTRIANMSPTAASTGADLNGQAAKLASQSILERLKRFVARILNIDDPGTITIEKETVLVDGAATDLCWENLIGRAYLDRISLSAQAHYATPHIYFDKTQEKGKPFVYHIFGAAAVEATVDCLRGTYQIDSVNIVHDVGHSLNPLIDQGQVEGGVVQGMGWMTIEEIKHDVQGGLLSDSLATYKIPDVYFAPEVSVHFLEQADNPPGLFHSKAMGEPPFMYGVGAYFAILNGMRAFKPGLNIRFSAPLTPEKVLMALYEGV